MLFGFDTKKKKILTMLTLIMLVGTSFLTGAVLALPPTTWSDQPTYIGPGSMVAGSSYIVFKDTAGATCAKNGITGKIDFRAADFGEVLNSAIDALGTTNNQTGKITIMEGNYTSSTPVQYPCSKLIYSTASLIISGVGLGTIIYYNGATNYAFRLSNDDRTLTQQYSTNSVLENMKIQAFTTTDGAVLLRGSCFNTLNQLKIECPNGVGIRLDNATVPGSDHLSLLNTINHVIVSDDVDVGVWSTGNSQAMIQNSEFIAGFPAIKWEGGILWIMSTEVRATSGTPAISVVNSTRVTCNNVFIDGAGGFNMNAGNLRAYGSKMTGLNCSTGVDFKLFGCDSVDQESFLATCRSIAPWPDYTYWANEAEQSIGPNDRGIKTIDAVASGGYSTTNNDTTNPGDWVFLHEFYYDQIIPQGKYLLTVNLKQSNAVANDARIVFRDFTDSVQQEAICSLSTSWQTYSFTFTVNSTTIGDQLRIYVNKVTASANNIYADYYTIRYIGSAFDTPTIGGGQDIIMVHGISALPTASASYRGCFAMVAGTTGTNDTMYCCLKNNVDNYIWVVVAVG